MKLNILHKLLTLSWERKLHFGALIVTVLGVFMPWISGQWLVAGAGHAYTGFGFFTGLLGTTVFLLAVTGLLLVIVPLTGGKPLVRPAKEPVVQLILAAQSVVLILATLTVLTKTTLEFARMEVRFGIYVSLIGSLVALLYAYLSMIDRNGTLAIQPSSTDLPVSPEPVSEESEDPPEPERTSASQVPPPPKPENHYLRP